MVKKKILISGYYGFGNAGDEAVLAGMIDSLRNAAYDTFDLHMTVLSGSPGSTRELHAVEAVPRFSRAALRVLKRSDLLVSGGGGLLQDRTSFRSLFYYASLILLAWMLRVPSAVFAQGIGPLRRRVSRGLVRFVLNRVDVIAVRDEGSKKLLESLGVARRIEVTADPAFLFEPRGDGSHGSEVSKGRGAAVKEVDVGAETAENGGRTLRRSVVGLAIRRGGPSSTAWAQFADRLFEEFGASVQFLAMHDPDDVDFAMETRRMMKGASPAAVLSSDGDPWRAAAIIEPVDLLVGMRFHAVQMAAWQGVPVVAVSYDPKIDALVCVLRQHGVEASLVEAQDLMDGTPGGEADGLLRYVRRRLEAGRPRASCVQPAGLVALRETASRTAQRVVELLRTRTVLGISIATADVEEAARIVERLITTGRNERRKAHLVATVNSEMAVLAGKDPELLRVLRGADLAVADSVGIAWAAGLRHRVPGIDLIAEIAALAAQRGYQVFLLGGRPGVAEDASRALVYRFPDLRVAGCLDGYFGPGREAHVVQTIAASGADILLVGTGMGRQEKWIAAHAERLGVPVGIGVGGSLDVLSGRVRRAPEWVRRAGLEWLFRFLQRPSRLARGRSLVRFAFLLVRGRHDV